MKRNFSPSPGEERGAGNWDRELLTNNVINHSYSMKPPFCCCSIIKLCLTLWDPMNCSTSDFCPSLSPRVCSDSRPLSQWWYLSHLLPPLHLLPSLFPGIRVFSNELALYTRWPKYSIFSFSITSPSNEHSGLISFRIHWFDILAVQGILKSLL